MVIGERRKDVAHIRLLRAVMWGVVAAAAVRLLTNMSDAVFANIVVLGAVSAAVSVALARVTRRHMPTAQQGRPILSSWLG